MPRSRRTYKKWSPEEVRELRRRVDRGETDEVIAAALDRTRSSIEWRRGEMSLSRIRSRSDRRHWTVEEISVLRERSGVLTDGQLAELLGRRVDSIRGRLALLGLQAAAVRTVDLEPLPDPELEEDRPEPPSVEDVLAQAREAAGLG